MPLAQNGHHGPLKHKPAAHRNPPATPLQAVPKRTCKNPLMVSQPEKRFYDVAADIRVRQLLSALGACGGNTGRGKVFYLGTVPSSFPAIATVPHE